mmetsp:Transcript_7726/g.24848  ORF Transcript_7726/g.24848 Transcript_7726/m.24848 type:complete len:332 (-) Transcript_7726:443-1438(-)
MHLAASLRLAKHDLLDFLDECCLGALLPGSEQERLVAEPCLGEGGALYPRPMVIYSRPFASPACRRDSLDRMENLRISRAGCRERRLHFSCSWRLGDRPRRVALLIDDAQEEYRSLMPPRVLSRLCDLVAAARAAGVVVLWSRWCRTSPTDAHYGALDEYFGPWGVASHDNPLYLASDKGRAIMHELAPRTAAERSRVIDSHAFDAFAARRRDGRSVLREELDAHGVDTLLLAGCWTESCVLSTAIRAVAEDLNVAVASDAVFTCADAGPAALRVLGVYCCMVRAAEMSAYLRDLASAGTLAEADATAVERTAALPVALAQPLPPASAEAT